MNSLSALRHRILNTLHTVLLLAAITALAGVLGLWLLGEQGIFWAAAIAVMALAFSPRVSPRWVLRATGARELSPWQAHALHQLIESIAERAELPRAPRLYYLPTRVLNAFATGSVHDSAITVTDGLLRAMTLRELAGVLAHEIAHVRGHDLWVMNLADVVGRLTGLLSMVGQALLIVMLPLSIFRDYELPLLPIVALILAPTVSLLLQLALSRTREYHADVVAAELTGDPEGLALALDKLERLQGGWIERMFMVSGRVPPWLRTHPRTQERVRRLLELRPARPPMPQLAKRGNADPFFELPLIARRPSWHWPGLWY
jgi:heat shock protein HtpX